MKLILEIIQVIANNKYIGKDKSGVQHFIDTDIALKIGQSVLTKNGIVIGIVQTEQQDVYEV